MKLKLISEIQYKQTSTYMDRVQSPGTRLQDSINDLYHNGIGAKQNQKKRRKPPKKKPDM